MLILNRHNLKVYECSIECILIGFNANSKVYKCYDRVTKEAQIERQCALQQGIRDNGNEGIGYLDQIMTILNTIKDIPNPELGMDPDTLRTLEDAQKSFDWPK